MPPWKFVRAAPLDLGTPGSRYNVAVEATCPACGETSSFTATGDPGERVQVQLGCGHVATHTMVHR